MRGKKSCDTCRFWTLDGQLDAPCRAGNEGICSAVLLNGRTAKVPFWAEDIARATISWQGEHCLAWTKKPGRLVKVRARGR